MDISLDEEERKKQLQREHKKRQHARAQQAFEEQLSVLVTRTGIALDEKHSRPPFLSLSAPSAPDLAIDWCRVPSPLDPAAPFTARGARRPQEDRVGLDATRGLRKRQQVESIARVVGPLVTHFRRMHGRPARVVDFGCGTGNASLTMSWLFRNDSVWCLVDKNVTSATIAGTRAQEAGLTNVTTLAKDAREYTEAFDIGVAVHVCGPATDFALERCLVQRAAFVLCPCCVGKLKFSEGQRPLSAALQKLIGPAEYLALARAGDTHEQHGEDVAVSGAMQEAKLLLEVDRVRYAQDDHAYAVCYLSKLEPPEASPKNDIVIGIADAAMDPFRPTKARSSTE